MRSVVSILKARPEIIEILTLFAKPSLPDGWVGAKLIRNPVWDAVSGVAVHQPPSGIDVIFFNPWNATREHDLALETALLNEKRSLRWSVKNQA